MINGNSEYELIKTLFQEEYSELLKICKHLAFDCFEGKNYYDESDCDGGYLSELRIVANENTISINARSCAEFEWENEFWKIVNKIERYK
ncbi:MAG: hypothetical protein JXA68_08085 [Ignavibacteriales bacterium]|nr:hypothetical protein [Ignavibacteriales bacterium]